MERFYVIFKEGGFIALLVLSILTNLTHTANVSESGQSGVLFTENPAPSNFGVTHVDPQS